MTRFVAYITWLQWALVGGGVGGANDWNVWNKSWTPCPSSSSEVSGPSWCHYNLCAPRGLSLLKPLERNKKCDMPCAAASRIPRLLILNWNTNCHPVVKPANITMGSWHKMNMTVYGCAAVKAISDITIGTEHPCLLEASSCMKIGKAKSSWMMWWVSLTFKYVQVVVLVLAAISAS